MTTQTTPKSCTWCWDGSPCPNHRTVIVTGGTLVFEVDRLRGRYGVFGPAAPEEDAMCAKYAELTGERSPRRVNHDVYTVLAAAQVADKYGGIHAQHVKISDLEEKVMVWGQKAPCDD